MVSIKWFDLIDIFNKDEELINKRIILHNKWKYLFFLLYLKNLLLHFDKPQNKENLESKHLNIPNKCKFCLYSILFIYRKTEQADLGSQIPKYEFW